MSDSDYATPEAAEQAFYRAFELANVDQMMAVWFDDPATVCVHPMGTPMQGTESIRASWSQIFSGDQRMHFKLEPHSAQISGELAVHTLVEKIYLHGDSKARPPIFATNVYVRTSLGWRMLVHHASPSVIDNTRESGTQQPPPALH